MPDRRRHRGAHPEDATLFAAEHHANLRQASADLCWLLSREYPPDAALKLVADRFTFDKRQRLALMRAACSDDALARRRAAMRPVTAIDGAAVGIDGFNVLITLEAALSGGLILACRDGCYRDLASVHGTYRRVSETRAAVACVIEYLARYAPAQVIWYLDSPVSNSGRLKALIEDAIASRAAPFPGPRADKSPAEGREARTPSDPYINTAHWRVELVANPDRAVLQWDLVASSDSVVLDRCDGWINLCRSIIDERMPQAWIVQLSSARDA